MPGTIRETASGRGQSAWDAIRRMLTSTDRTYLVMPRCVETLAWLGFWDMLESTEAVLDGHDWRSPPTREIAGEDKSDALCVLEDPPTLLLCTIGSLPGKLLIMDVENYGIETITSYGLQSDDARYYMGGLCDCLSALRESRAGSLRCTAGAQAVSILRTDGKCALLHCHTHDGALKLERASLYGGRCEPYRLGKIAGPVYHLDVKSLYPSICRTLPIPVSLTRYHEPANDGKNPLRGSAEHAIARVRIRTNLAQFPFRYQGHTVYPTGEFTTVLGGTDLSEAVSAGAITHWYEAAEYYCTPLLAPMYEWWLARLMDAERGGRTIERSWIKAILNCLPGKFAENGRRWIACEPWPDKPPYCTWTATDHLGVESKYRNVAWYTQKEEVHGESYWSVPAVASHITARGRQTLYRLQCVAGRQNVWYSDTDSLFVNERGYQNLCVGGAVRESEIGYLRVCGTHTSLAVYGIRHYELGEAVTCAGVPKGTLKAGEREAEYHYTAGASESLGLGLQPGSARLRGRYTVLGTYHGGKIGKDGTVTPLEIYGE